MKLLLKDPPANIPREITVHDRTKVGGEGTIYFSTDGKYAIKIYHNPAPDKELLITYVMKLFNNLPLEQTKYILPPIALVERFGNERKTGFLMKRVPDNYVELIELILTPQNAATQFKKGITWGNYLKTARSIANALVTLHGKGCAHSDIHYRNFMVNLIDGDAIMLEIDGVVVKGFLPPQVKGMMGFMAPEILTDNVNPDEKTDRHSLAVLILHTLLFRNVMLPLKEYDNDPIISEELGWGKFALFSEHQDDRSNRPSNLGLPLYHKGALSYKMLSPNLRNLTERAFIEGLRNPDKRPSSREWEEALATAIDELWWCSRCQQHFPYPYWIEPIKRRSCPFCGSRINTPHPAVIELYEERQKHSYVPIGRRLVLGDSFKLFPDMLIATKKPLQSRRNETPLGYIEYDDKFLEYRLINNDSVTWTARSPDGKINEDANNNQSIPIRKGYYIYFGEGKRLAVVKEAPSILG